MKIIYDKQELNGTCYFEILPGPYNRKCWNDGSIYFEEDVFGYLGLSIEKVFPQFDLFGFVTLESEVWKSILIELEELKQFLRQPNKENYETKIGFFWDASKKEFISDFEINCERLSNLVDEFQRWIEITLTEKSSISILGI